MSTRCIQDTENLTARLFCRKIRCCAPTTCDHSEFGVTRFLRNRWFLPYRCVDILSSRYYTRRHGNGTLQLALPIRRYCLLVSDCSNSDDEKNIWFRSKTRYRKDLYLHRRFRKKLNIKIFNVKHVFLHPYSTLVSLTRFRTQL